MKDKGWITSTRSGDSNVIRVELPLSKQPWTPHTLKTCATLLEPKSAQFSERSRLTSRAACAPMSTLGARRGQGLLKAHILHCHIAASCASDVCMSKTLLPKPLKPGILPLAGPGKTENGD